MYYLAFFITHVIAMSSTCYNPFLYGWMNTGEKFTNTNDCKYRIRHMIYHLLFYVAFRAEFTKLCSCFLPFQLVISKR